MFAFLFLVFIILLITCSEATVLLCYFHLCAEVRHKKLMHVKLSKLALLKLEVCIEKGYKC